ncbi:MAG TPA: hypothetical protein VGQ35_16255 [Dongiaceae bacterium]|nr:hypothetical protein [Dongiaceae bacterium]
MASAAIHRRWAREFLARAVEARNRGHKLRYLHLAVNNCIRAQHLETDELLKQADE